MLQKLSFIQFETDHFLYAFIISRFLLYWLNDDENDDNSKEKYGKEVDHKESEGAKEENHPH